ncbi:MAG: aminotransferase class III-fold pyridoxal phosphate-dependent enzyme, partial [Candidatus Marinimicrobia bacterium]|nr:aminotransferase class III-fold pyridoxal phosphate-dependent enzyme [Candidatus Neomarinimicrobiota bacterium]
QHNHEIIGEVRGRGLFIGVELVNGPDLTPAADEAHNIVNRMKDKGILLSTDGPDHNVIKIKPPMVFNKENADDLTVTLNNVLGEYL